MQEEETYCEGYDIEDDEMEQKLKQEIEEKVGKLRGTGVYKVEVKKVETKDDIYSMINDNIDGIFICEQTVRGITSGDVPFDVAFAIDDMKDELYNTLVDGVDNVQ